MLLLVPSKTYREIKVSFRPHIFFTIRVKVKVSIVQPAQDVLNTVRRLFFEFITKLDRIKHGRTTAETESLLQLKLHNFPKFAGFFAQSLNPYTSSDKQNQSSVSSVPVQHVDANRAQDGSTCFDISLSEHIMQSLNTSGISLTWCGNLESRELR